jgi:hypothetical protein
LTFLASFAEVYCRNLKRYRGNMSTYQTISAQSIKRRKQIRWKIKIPYNFINNEKIKINLLIIY